MTSARADTGVCPYSKWHVSARIQTKKAANDWMISARADTGVCPYSNGTCLPVFKQKKATNDWMISARADTGVCPYTCLSAKDEIIGLSGSNCLKLPEITLKIGLSDGRMDPFARPTVLSWRYGKDQ